jgi:hypothetical protein
MPPYFFHSRLFAAPAEVLAAIAFALVASVPALAQIDDRPLSPGAGQLERVINVDGRDVKGEFTEYYGAWRRRTRLAD